MECEVKWTLGRITANKANESDGIPAELFQILKYDAAKVLHSICQFGKLNSGHMTGKGPFFIPIPKKGNAKDVQTTTQ